MLWVFIIILLNATVYFICQTIASTCLTQVLAQFPVQVESLFPFRAKRVTKQPQSSSTDEESITQPAARKLARRKGTMLLAPVASDVV